MRNSPTGYRPSSRPLGFKPLLAVLIAFATFAVVACEQSPPTVPNEGVPLGPIEDMARKFSVGPNPVLAAAERQSPVQSADLRLIGVLDRDQTETERRIVYVTESERLEYRFVWRDGWKRGEQVGVNALHLFSDGDGPARTAGFSEVIQEIEIVKPDQSTYSFQCTGDGVTESGEYTCPTTPHVAALAGHEPVEGQFFPGTYWSGGAKHVLTFEIEAFFGWTDSFWRYQRADDPDTWVQCSAGENPCDFLLAGDTVKKAESYGFRAVVTPRVEAGIDGPTEVNEDQTCTWFAEASHGQPPYSYSWSGAGSGTSSSISIAASTLGSVSTLYLTVTDDNDYDDTASIVITVDDTNSQPMCMS